MKNAKFVYTRGTSRRGAGLKRSLFALVVITLSVGGGYWFYIQRRADAGSIDIATAPKTQVARSDLVVTILQAGDLQAKNSKAITNETETNAQILEIVEDGERVEKGDLLVKLDVSELQDRVLNEENKVANAEASYQQAEEQLALKELQYQTDLESAILRVDLAKLEIKKYEEAEYPQEVRKAQMNITLAEEDLNSAKTKMEDTRTLVEKGYTNRQELETVEMEVQRKEVDLLNKREDLRILQEYTHEKQFKQLNNELRKAEANLEQLKKSYKNERASTLVNLESRKTNLEIARNQFERIKSRLSKAEVYSEYEGLVFYAENRRRWSNDPAIEVGSTMRREQKILEFPDLSAWKVNVGIPESLIKQIEIGQEAFVTIDALPGEVIEAKVAKISQTPNRTAWWDPNSKVYTVELDVTKYDDLFLKPGMSTMVEIITSELKDVLQVPLQAVRTEGDEHSVYVVEGKTMQKTPVTVGAHNEKNIQIVSGLDAGQTVLLYAPASADTTATRDKRPMDAEEKNDEKEAATEEATPSDAQSKESPTKQTEERQGRGAGEKSGTDSKRSQGGGE
ncbi:MAG: efflux RND transporter periplasmic adaptor subunit [Candidatus Sumerlaeota bacterium]